ncbi:hypothetical protein BH09SUM1_BH09SUM1_04060 [soil metagenome]
MDLIADLQYAPLIRSTSVAMPFDEDPWAALARGLRKDRAEIVDVIGRWQREGVLRGVWGEPNPTPTPERRYLKVGFPMNDAATVQEMLAQGNDRTYVVQQYPPAPPLTEDEREIATALNVPMTVETDKAFWPQVACGKDLRADDLAKRLVIAKVWRRFALRFNLFRIGMRGCGRAEWNFDSESEAAMAGEALVALRCTGDVKLRRTNGSHALTAIFISRKSDIGEQAAEAIAIQWARPVNWAPLNIE